MTDWLEQTDNPLFPNLLWSKPETKLGAGKSLIIGGQAQEFIHVAECFSEAEKAGAGSIRVFMPDSTKKITQMLPNIEYAASNASGSFARVALDELIEAAEWADGVLLAGDLGKNSETSLMLENFIKKYTGLLILANQALSSLSLDPKELFSRNNTILVASQTSLQKLLIQFDLKKPITSKSSSATLAEVLHKVTSDYPIYLVMQSREFTWAAATGQVSATKIKSTKSLTQLAAQTSVWSVQNPSQLFKALTTAVYC